MGNQLRQQLLDLRQGSTIIGIISTRVGRRRLHCSITVVNHGVSVIVTVTSAWTVSDNMSGHSTGVTYESRGTIEPLLVTRGLIVGELVVPEITIVVPSEILGTFVHLL